MCEPGWIGDLCSVYDDDDEDDVFELNCTKSCEHGVCVKDSNEIMYCICNTNWIGDLCNVVDEEEDDDVFELNCTKSCEHGVCVKDSNEIMYCICNQGWIGDLCSVVEEEEEDDDVFELNCTKSCDHGVCVKDSNETMYCICNQGWIGDLCSVYDDDDEDDVFELNCTKSCDHGVCVKDSNETMYCVCDTNWIGDSCEEETEEITCDWPTEGVYPNCTRITCWGVDAEMSGVCGYKIYRHSHGSCIAKNTCLCCCGWEGSSCNGFNYSLYKECVGENQGYLCNGKGQICHNGICDGDEDSGEQRRGGLFNEEEGQMWSEIFGSYERIEAFFDNKEKNEGEKLELLKKLHKLYENVEENI